MAQDIAKRNRSQSSSWTLPPASYLTPSGAAPVISA